MGKILHQITKPFTKKQVNDKQLVIKMLKYEEEYAKALKGQELYKNSLNEPLISLNVEKIFNRITLNNFGFDTSDESVEMFRTIFRAYYKSSLDYDADVINSSYYMRGNKCMFYKEQNLFIGDKIPDTILYNVDGIKNISLHNIVKGLNANYVMIAAFSLS